MRQFFVFSASLTLAGLIYMHSAAALPVVDSSIAGILAVGEERVQQAHVRRYRHRHRAYRRYRTRRPFTCHSASAIMAATISGGILEVIMEAITAATTSLTAS